MPRDEVVIVGAGPYGLSIAAHLRQRKTPFRIFGVPMQNWREAAPPGMFLKSDGAGSNLFDPRQNLTLARYCSSRGIAYSDHSMPIPLETFIEYALHFQQQLVPEVENSSIVALAGNSGDFELTTDRGEKLKARSVVVAVGTTYFGHVPSTFSRLPRELATHSRDHSDLSRFAQREVIVIGGGQSALEIAALLNEQGARVQLLVRAADIQWNPGPSYRNRVSRPQTGLGMGWKPWFYCHGLPMYQRIPLRFRKKIIKRALGPAGAWWLKNRVLGRFPILCNREVREAREESGRVCLSVAGPDRRITELSADHVIAATGYRVDLDLLPFLDPELSRRICREGSAPALSPDFESSIPGLYFTGLASAIRFGPAMRFVVGAEYTARRISRSLGAIRRTSDIRNKAEEEPVVIRA